VELLTMARSTAVQVLLLLAALLAPAEARRDRPRERPLRVTSVDFSGNRTFSRRILLDRMATKPSRLFNRVKYSARVFDDDARVVQSFYRNQGFLDAAVSVYHVHVDSAQRRVAVVILVEERSRTYVGRTEFDGNRVIGTPELLRSAKTATGKPLLSSVVDDDAGRIVGRYGRTGYLQTAVRPEVALRTGGDTADVRFVIVEAGVSTVGERTVTGLRRVKPLLVERELKFDVGDTLTTDRIRASVDGLYRTGLFAQATVTPLLRDSASGEPLTATDKVVVTNVKEAALFDVSVGLGYATDEQVRGSLETTYRNLFGRGKRISLNGRASFRSQKAELVYTDPRFLTMPARFDLTGHYGHYDEEAYEALIGGVQASLSIASRHHLEYRLRLRFDDVAYVPAAADTAKPTRSLYGSVAYNTRNDLFSPSRGVYLALQGEFAGLGRATNQFLRGILDARGHIPIRLATVLSTGIRLGYVHEIGTSRSVPIEERFYAGGNTSLRGFRTRMVGPLAPVADGALKPTGGRVLIEAHPLELRIRLYRALHATAFLDAGGVYDGARTVSLANTRWSAGGGLSVKLPLGVIRAEVGFPLDRNGSDPDEPWAWPHIDIGYAF